MPIYEYQCAACGQVVERWQKISDSPLADCPGETSPAKPTMRVDTYPGCSRATLIFLAFKSKGEVLKIDKDRQRMLPFVHSFSLSCLRMILLLSPWFILHLNRGFVNRTFPEGHLRCYIEQRN